MLDLIRYPKFNDQPHERPALSYGEGPWAEYIWLSIPVIAVAGALVIAFLAR